MSLSDILPFTEDVSDQLFLDQVVRLIESGNPLSNEEFFQIYLESRADIVHAISLYGPFWLKFMEFDRVDVSNPASSFYNLVIARNRYRIELMSEETASRSFRLLSMSLNGHTAVAEATNAFLNAMIDEMKKPNSVLSMALV